MSINATFVPCDLHADATVADTSELEKADAAKFYSKQQQKAKKVNLKFGWVEDKDGNEHPERVQINRRDNLIYATRSDEAREAVLGDGAVTMEAFGFLDEE